MVPSIAGAHGWIARGRSDVDYAEFEANRMTAEDRAFFDENGYVRPPLPALPLRFGGAPCGERVRQSYVGLTCAAGARLHR